MIAAAVCAPVSVPHMAWGIEAPTGSLSAVHRQAEVAAAGSRKRPKRQVETMEYLSAVERLIRAAGRRVGDSDEPELARLFELGEVLDRARTVAIRGLRDRGVSWRIIGAAVGVTAEAARVRWDTKVRSLSQARFSAADLAGVTHVRDRFGWHRVVKVNAQTVTVETVHSWTKHISIAQILAAGASDAPAASTETRTVSVS